MSTLTAERRAWSSREGVVSDADSLPASPPLFDGLGGRPTLDELLAGAWEGLAAHAVVECPICQGELEPQYGVHARPIGGRCRSCGATLT